MNIEHLKETSVPSVSASFRPTCLPCLEGTVNLSPDDLIIKHKNVTLQASVYLYV